MNVTVLAQWLKSVRDWDDVPRIAEHKLLELPQNKGGMDRWQYW